MTREQALTELSDIAKGNHAGDTEVAHSHADWVLCELLISLGYKDVVDALDKIDKWYA